MRTDILTDIKKRLLADYKFKDSGGWLRAGKCPSCGKKELYAHAESPWVIRCGRSNNCGYEGHAKDLYRDLFEDFNKKHKPTPENPNATADAYLRYARGFDLKAIKGWYRQEKFWHPHGNKGTATVRFDIDRENNIFMERLVEDVSIKDEDGSFTLRKAHFGGKHRGLFWFPPGMKFDKDATVWIVEGILDAIALWQNGIKAVSMLSCTNYPSKSMELHKDKNIRWIFALDNDPAGKRYTKKWVKKAKSEDYRCGSAQIPSVRGQAKQDWNDLHLKKALSKEEIREHYYQGDLLCASTALTKAMLIWGHSNKENFSFTYNNKLYWFKTDIEKLNKAKQEIYEANPNMDEKEVRTKAVEYSGMLREICNCHPSFLYFLSHEATGESWYFCNISFPNGRPAIKTTFSGSQIASSAEFKKRLLSAAPGGLYTGSGRELDWIVKNNLNNIKQVKTVDYVGYAKEHEAYIYNDFAVKKGRIFKANREDYVEIDKLSIKTLSGSFKFNIGNAHQYNANWPELIYQAWGYKGLVALTFWFGSLFAEQIRSAQKSFPFLEIVGEPGSGKTTLIEFLWRTFGLEDTEGFDPSKSTFASIRRKFAQVSNMPIVLLEGDRETASKYKQFDFNQLKDSYNGRAFGERGIKNGGNETYAPAFKAAIVISQNNDVQGSDAVLQRIIHLNINTDSHTKQTRIASEAINQISVDQVSYFLLKVITKEKKIMEMFLQNTGAYEKRLLAHDKITNIRIAKNHAQIMSLATCMVNITGLPKEHLYGLHDYIETIAAERERAVKADHPLLQDFWEAYEYMNGEDAYPKLNHARDAGTIAINLNHFVKVANENKQQIPTLSELKPLLRQTRTHKFIDTKAINSNVLFKDEFCREGRTVKCWVFEKKKAG